MIGIISAELLRKVSDTLILPYNFNTYAKQLMIEYEAFEADNKKDLDSLGIKYDDIKHAINNFTLAASNFHKRLNSIDKTKFELWAFSYLIAQFKKVLIFRFHLIRMYNDQLRNVDRGFLDGSGLLRNGYQ